MKEISLKLQHWSRKDIAKNVATYVCNLVVICLLFIGTVYLDCARAGKPVTEFFADLSDLFNFIILMVLTFGVMFLYFMFEDRNFLRNAVNSEMLFLALEVSIVLSYAIGRFVNPYLRPLALTALLTLFLVNSRTAVFMNVIYCIMNFIFDSFSAINGSIDIINEVFFFLMGISSGVIAIYCMKNVYSRLRLLLTSFVISAPTLACIAIPITAVGTGGNALVNLGCGLASGPVAVVAFIVLLPVFETVFKKVSCFKFAEFTDHKSKFLRKLIAEAPGTFNHSIVVSNIAEACATAIGEDALLARTCAYYHDIGKLRRSEYFKENQAEGDNPHNDLMPELSAHIIKSHTTDGYNLITKARMPKEIADVCLQHHGTMPILYFYDKAKKFTDGEVDIRQYCYAGPKPQSKIAAILMIADSCEAATRTLKDRSRDKVTKVVRKIVSDRMQLGQFDECEITLKELNIVIYTVINNLTGIYHSRIAYPKVSLEGLELDD